MSFRQIHVNSCNSCQFMSFISIHIIYVNSCNLCQFMSIHVIPVNSCHSCYLSLDFCRNSVMRGVGGREGQMCLPRPSATASLLLTFKICFFRSKKYIPENLKMVIYPCVVDHIHFILDNSCICQNKLILILNGNSLDQQVGVPTVPLAFISRSEEWHQSRHILVALVTMSCHFMLFMQIQVNLCNSCQFMSFMSVHVIPENSC
jgi:hypothetical protein